MDTPTPPTTSFKDAGVLVGLFFLYAAAGRIGLSIYELNPFATFVWAPSGIALAGLLIYGYGVWPAIAIGAFVLNLSIGVPLVAAILISCGNTVGPLTAAFLIKEFAHYKPRQFSLRDSFSIVLGALLLPLITASIGTATLWLTGAPFSITYTDLWQMWLLGDAVGVIIFTPLILKWWNHGVYERTTPEKLEIALVAVIIVITSYYVFWSPQLFYAYYLFIPLTWAALRTGPRGTTLSMLIILIVGTWGTSLGQGTFGGAQGLFQMEVFVAITAGIFLIIAAIVEERRNILQEVENHVGQLEIALAQIRSEDEAKKNFLAVLAHELRNPLATIISSIELIHLEYPSVPSSLRRSLETIAERSSAMVYLLDDLLDISRVSHHKLKLNKELVRVDSFIDRLLPTIQHTMHQFGHTFSVTTPNQELFVEADPLRFEQILTNLLSNAAKYTHPHGSVELMVRKESNQCVIAVRDSGVGIPRNMLSRIFEPFFQARSELSANQGLGVGLALTRELVELHGGTIEVKSAGSGRGSEFTVRLPLAKNKRILPSVTAPTRRPATREPKSPERRQTLRHSLKILVVDDNESATRALTRLLELRGHTARPAYDGTEALGAADKFAPDVIFLDIGLPDTDGYEVARILQEHDRPYYLIALTGYGQAEDKARAQDAGFDAHLTKPASLAAIEAILEDVPAALNAKRKAARSR